MKKRVLIILCMLVCLFLSPIAAKAEAADFDEEALKQTTQSLVDEWFSLNFADMLEEYAAELEQEGNEKIKAEYEDFAALQETCGAYQEISEFSFAYEEDEEGNTTAQVTAIVACEKETLSVTTSFDKNGILADYRFEKYQPKEESVSKADQMKTAGINTVMSMVIVFAVLILIACLIACFVFIGKIQEAMENREQATPVAQVAKPAAATTVKTIQSKDEDLTDDLELVAVITAAIVAASGAESADGLVVRSIVRRG